MYRSTCEWRDMTDKHLYKPGESFPFDGREIPADRIESLKSGKNRAGVAVIREVKERPAFRRGRKPENKPEEVKEEKTEEKAEEKTEAPKKTRSRKKKTEE